MSSYVCLYVCLYVPHISLNACSNYDHILPTCSLPSGSKPTVGVRSSPEMAVENLKHAKTSDIWAA